MKNGGNLYEKNGSFSDGVYFGMYQYPGGSAYGGSNRNRLRCTGGCNQFRGRSGCDAGEPGRKLLSGGGYHDQGGSESVPELL